MHTLARLSPSALLRRARARRAAVTLNLEFLAATEAAACERALREAEADKRIAVDAIWDEAFNAGRAYERTLTGAPA